jgi:hypothetical protein
LAKEITNEEDMFREILKYFLTTQETDSEKNLRKKYCKENSTLLEYFRRVWTIYSVLEIIVNDKINIIYKNSTTLEISKVNYIIDLIYDSIRRFQYEYKTMHPILDSSNLKKSRYTLKSDEDILNDFKVKETETEEKKKEAMIDAKKMIEYKNEMMISLNQLKNSISDILNRIINSSLEYTPNINYENVPNPIYVENHPTNRYVFKDVLYKILREDDNDFFKVGTIQYITVADILQIIEQYNGIKGYINSDTYSRNHILMTTLDFLKALDIIKDSKNPYEVVPFKDREWKLDALTKVDTIEKILKNLDKVKTLTKKQKKYVYEIFQFTF